MRYPVNRKYENIYLRYMDAKETIDLILQKFDNGAYCYISHRLTLKLKNFIIY